MGFFNWVKRGGKPGHEPEPQSAPCFTDKGNAIETTSSLGWLRDGTGECELRLHLGESIEGHHAGLEVSRRGADGPVCWSRPYGSELEAYEACWVAWRRSFGGEEKAAAREKEPEPDLER